ncbi:MAG: competence/damage-inducible protein A [Halobacteriota archaeon]
MDVALLTIGEELLSGATANTNASWLAGRLSDRGVDVRRILVLPDDRSLIEATLREWVASFDAVIVTGGLGGTHDDVTMDAVAAAFDRELLVDEVAREDVLETIAAFRESHPELVERYDPRVDPDAQASIPEGARPLCNPVGLSPGCVLESVYVLPGIPEEMRAMFELVESEFDGDRVTETLYTPVPESSMTQTLEEFHDRFDVVAGSYPGRARDPNRLTVTGTDRATLEAAIAWLEERIDTIDPE